MKNSVKKLIVSLMAIVMFAYVGIMVYSKQAPVDAVTVEFTATDVQDNYDVNDLATFPLSVDVSYNGATKTAENGILLYPSGKIVNITANPIEFTEQGEYKLRYFFMDGSVKVTAEKSFTVSNDLYYLTSNGGSVTPVTAEMNAAADMDTLDDNTMATEKEGIIVRLAEGCMFKYNKPIDLSKCDENGLTNIIAIDPRIYEIILSEDGSKFTNNGTIASEVKIKLTDCYEPGTFVEIILECSNTIYTRVGTNTQTSGGCKYPDEGKVSGTI